MHFAISYFRLGSGYILLILIHLSTVHLNLPQFEGERRMTVFLRMIGTSFFDIRRCFKTQSQVSTFLHIRYTLIAERMCLITIRLTAMSFVSKHLIHPKVLAIVVILDKRSWNVREQPPIFSFLHIRNIVRPSGSGGEQWSIVSGPITRDILFGPTAPGIIFVSQLLVHWSFLTPKFCQQKCLVSATTIFGPLKGLSP